MKIFVFKLIYCWNFQCIVNPQHSIKCQEICHPVTGRSREKRTP
eukprot:UN01740